MANQTPRLNAPYIISTQSQKEVTHNTALNMFDALIQTSVETATLLTPPLLPQEGGLWLISAVATGAWVGHDNEIGQFIGGVWQFYVAFEGMEIWLKDENISAQYRAGLWIKGVVTANKLEILGQQIVGAQQASIMDAAGGIVIDVEARAALNTLLAACRMHGLIAP